MNSTESVRFKNQVTTEHIHLLPHTVIHALNDDNHTITVVTQTAITVEKLTTAVSYHCLHSVECVLVDNG